MNEVIVGVICGVAIAITVTYVYVFRIMELRERR